MRDNISWDTYSRILGASDADFREDLKNEQTEAMTESLRTLPSYRENSTVNGNLTEMSIVKISGLKAEFNAAPDKDITIGDIVCDDDDVWIVADEYEDAFGFKHGTLWLCNYRLSFQNHSDEIHQRPCVIDDGRYGKQTTNTEVYAMSNTYTIYLPKDEQTSQLYVDKRLSVGTVYDKSGKQILEVYKIYGIDSFNDSFGKDTHLLTLFVQRSTFNPETDDFSRDICDVYHDDEGEHEQEEGRIGTCKIIGRDTIRIGTDRIYSFDISPSNDISPQWSIDLPTGSPITTTENDDGTFTVSVPLNFKIIGQEFTLHLTTASEHYGSDEMKVTVISNA